MIGWLTLTGLYVYRQEFDAPNDADVLEGDVVLEEGANWLILQREEESIGYVHRTTTRLQEGWLLEYEMLLAISLLGEKIPIDTKVTAKLDKQAYVSDFDAEIRAAGRSLSAAGEVDGTALLLNIEAGSTTSRRELQLEERPRLATNAFDQVLARDDLEAGDTFENRYFDPTSLGMRRIVLEYRGREQTEVFDRKVHASHVRQRVAGQTFDVYLDDDGRILVQEFPLEIVGARVSSELGKARASSIRRRVQRIDFSGSALSEVLGGTGMETALDILGVGTKIDSADAGTTD